MSKKEEIRASVEYETNLGIFDAIIQKHGDKHDFCIINDAKGSVQRHEMKGWKVWETTSLYDSDFEKKLGLTTSDNGLAGVPCGIAADGKPTKAYLMFAPKGTIDRLDKIKQNENKVRKSAYGSAAGNKATASVGGGIETFVPAGFGTDGMKHISN